MNDMAMAVREAAKPKFRGQKKLKSKVVTHHPDNLAREYVRITNSYMKLLNDVVKKHMPKIKAAATRNRQMRADDDDSNMSKVIREAFEAMRLELDEKIHLFDLEKKLDNLANLSRKLTVNEWKRVVKQTLGIDILDDYYMGEFYREALKQWTQKNIDLITTIHHETLSDMQSIAQEGFASGKSNSSIAKEIQEKYNISKSHAEFLARDQIAKLNADLTKSQQTDAGVEEYIWSDSGDGRVRDRHHSLNGKTFSWNDPPVVSEPGKPERRCHPGEDYRCRCVALPKFNIETLNLPMAQGRKEANPHDIAA